MIDAVLNGSGGILQLVHFRRKRLEAVGPLVTGRRQRPDLRDILQPVVAIHQNTVGVEHVGDGDGGVGDAGNMHEAGAFGEELGLAREVMVEGVMHQLIDIAAAGRIDCPHGLGLGAQRGDREA